MTTSLLWTPPANTTSDEPGPYERDVGAFRMLAWADGYWAIVFAESGEWIVNAVDKADDLAQAQRVVEGRLRGMVLATAEAMGMLRGGVSNG